MSTADSSSQISINVKGPSELKIQIDITTDKTVLDLKRAIAVKSDVEAERQRLIYSGRVLKDEDLLSQYKIQSGHTIHMVKGAARTESAPSTSQPQQLPTMQTGQNPSDPLTQLNSHMAHGLMAGFNPFAQLGVNPNDPNMFQGMMDSPQFLQQMASAMSNPAIVDQIIAMNPQLRDQAPQIRQVFQSEQFRQMMSNPESLRMMLQMSNMLRESGLSNGFNGGLGGGGPGLFGAAAQPQAGTPSTGTDATPTNAPPPNLFGGLPFLPPHQQPQADGTTGGSPPPPSADQMAGLFQYLNMAGGLPGLGGFGSPAAQQQQPGDTRPPEERFQTQLQQLQEMGFTNAAQNVRALLATGGNVHAAIEYILSGGGL